MKPNYTDITVVIDRSGSMSGLASDTIGGFNTMLAEQQAVPGEATITVNLFDHEFLPLIKGTSIKSCPKLNNETYVPRGNTALLDAIGRSINETGSRLSSLDEADRPSKVVFIIQTDGLENASKEFTKAKVREMIKRQQDVYNWEFVFMGANQDAFAESASFGMKAGSGMTYHSSSYGTQMAYDSFSKNLSSFRSGTKGGMSFTASDLKAQKDAESK